jgi:uncharacterized membrane protein HdeD (DUF308 family)
MTGPSSILSRTGSDAHLLCKRAWWVFLVGGLASAIFGVLAFASPGLALLVLAMFFAASVLVDGVFSIAGAVQNREKDGWWILLLIGLLGVLVGLFALLNPPISMLAFVYIVAFQAILLGVFLVMLGYEVRKATTREWILYLTGAMSLLFGILVLVNPLAGGFSIVYLIASWAIVIGVLKVAFAFRVKSLPDRMGDRISGLR